MVGDGQKYERFKEPMSKRTEIFKDAFVSYLAVIWLMVGLLFPALCFGGMVMDVKSSVIIGFAGTMLFTLPSACFVKAVADWGTK